MRKYEQTTPKDRERIWKLKRKNGMTGAALAIRFGLSETQIYNIVYEVDREKGTDRKTTEVS